MAGVNKVILIGNLGRDPEIRYSQQGTAIANFSIATSEDWKDKNTGEKKSKVEWHNITAFRRLAEICGEYLSKGSKIYVEGKLETSSWEQDGVTKYKTQVIIHIMQMLGGRGEGAGGDPQEPHRQVPFEESAQNQPKESRSQGHQSSGSQPQGNQWESEPEDDDIPF